MPAFGIDLGTTNSSISWLVDGRPAAIPIDGQAIVPSVVLFDAERVVVGREARNLELQRPEATVRSVKRRMGREHRYCVDGRTLTPEQVSAEILLALKRGAEAATGQLVRDVVITVPAYFDDAQRRATLRAGEIAGLNVLRLLNEPTSASLVYDQVAGRDAAASEMVMVYDLGGGTFDVSILEVCGGIREVRSTNGNTHLGGDDLDDLIVQRLVEVLRRAAASPRNDPRAMARLRRRAEEAKIALSSHTEVTVREEFICNDDHDRPVNLEARITRREFEEMAAPLLDTTIELCQRALDDAHLEGQRLSRICLVGGSTRIPAVRARLAAAFDVEVHEEIDPDLAVALGASIQSGMLAGEPVERILVDVASHSLGMRVISDADYGREAPDTFAPVLYRNTVLPAVRTEEFYTVVDDQPKVVADVFQGEAPRCSQNALIGSFEFALKPVPERSPVQVIFAYDLNGVVRVSMSQPGQQNEKTVALSVADAGRDAQQGSGARSALERKARALLGRLQAEDRDELQRRLDAYLAASGEARSRAEDALLDFFLECDAGEEALDDGGDPEDGE